MYIYTSLVWYVFECPQNSCRLRSLNPSSLSKHSTSGLPPAAPCKEEPHLSEDNPCQTTSETSSYPAPSAPNVPQGKTYIRAPSGLRLSEFFSSVQLNGRHGRQSRSCEIGSNSSNFLQHFMSVPNTHFGNESKFVANSLSKTQDFYSDKRK